MRVELLNQYILPVFFLILTVIALTWAKFGSSEPQTLVEHIDNLSTYFWWKENPSLFIIPGKPQLRRVTTQLALFWNSWSLSQINNSLPQVRDTYPPKKGDLLWEVLSTPDHAPLFSGPASWNLKGMWTEATGRNRERKTSAVTLFLRQLLLRCCIFPVK